MAEVNFYLKNPGSGKESVNTPSLIYLFFSFDGMRLKYSTSESITPKNWNSEAQRAKRSTPGASDLNDWLDKLSEDIKRIYRTLKTNNEKVNPEILREKLNEVIRRNKKLKHDLLSFIQEFIISVQGLKAKSTIKTQRNTLKRLQEYRDYCGKRIDFDTIDIDFYNHFTDFLITVKQFSPNTIGKHIKNLKMFLNEATDRGLNSKLDFKNKRFKILTEETAAIYLTEEEIEQLDNLGFKKDQRLERVKDLFIVGCYTGLRFSDFSQLKPENINKGQIKIRTQKTNELVVIPVHPKVNNILKKYNGELPPAISNQKMNEYLKEIGQMAELNETIEISKVKGGLKTKSFLKKHELITTHTARRSFATNLYLKGFPAISIMKITGHRSEKAFLGYLKMSNEQNADLLADFWAKNN